MALLFRLLGRLPLRLLQGLGTFFGWVAYLASPTYRRHLKENLALAYDPDEATAILPAAVATPAAACWNCPGCGRGRKPRWSAW